MANTDSKEIEVDVNQAPTATQAIFLPRSEVADMVDKEYKIHPNEEIEELSNDFSKYYFASNVSTEEEYFAIIYNNKYLPPVGKISTVAKQKFKAINNIVAYSIVQISSTKTEHLVVIVRSYDYKNNLEEYVAQNGHLAAEKCESIVQKLSANMDELNQLAISDFEINPKNIILKDGEFQFLREFIGGQGNYHQPNEYIAPELLTCHKAARCTRSSKPDVYALGMTIFRAYTANAPWTQLNSERDYNNMRLEYTTYKYLLGKTKLPERMKAFFKFTLHDNAQIRWRITNLVEWSSGKHSKYTGHESILERNNIVIFNEQNYSNLISLSYALYNQWEKALKFIKEDKLYKWANREQVGSDIIKEIKDFVNMKGGEFVATNSAANAKLSYLLGVIDPLGPVRHHTVAYAPESLPFFMHYLIAKNKRFEFETIYKSLQIEAWREFVNKDAAGYFSKEKRELFSSVMAIIDFNSPAKSLERFLYNINPQARCSSKMLERYYVNDIPSLIKSLENYAEINPGKFLLDKNIVAFISAKLELKRDIRPIILNNFIKIADHPAITTLSVMHILYKHEPNIKIPNICKAVGVELTELFNEHLHNVVFKKKIISNIEAAAETGDINEIIKVLSNQQPFINDYNGYLAVCEKVKLYRAKIDELDNSTIVFETALEIGQKATVLLSYSLCLIVTLVVML